MEVKPGYKQTEVGVIPEEWRLETVGTIAAVGRGRVISHREIAKALSPLYPVYSSQTSDNGVMGHLDSYDFEGEYVTWTTDGANAGTVFYRNGRFNCTNVCGTIKVCSDDARFVSLVLSRVAPRHVSRHLGNPKLMNDVMKRAVIPLPQSVGEQRAIAEALGDVDGLLGGLDRLIAKKRDLKQAAMQQLLTGQTRLSGFDGEWEMKTFDELFNFSGGYSASRDQLSSDGHCYLHYGDIHGATKTTVDVRADYENIPKLDIPLKRVASKSLLEDGDVVFVDASEDDEGASRHVVVVNKHKKPFISGLHTIVAKSKTDELAHEYRRYCFQTSAIRQQFLFYAVGTKVSGISKTNIAKLKMPVPKVPEQTAIAEVLSEMDAELAVLEQRREKTRALKHAMMQELLTGRIRLVGRN